MSLPYSKGADHAEYLEVKQEGREQLAPPNNEFADVFTPLYLNSVARMAELQKNSLDVVAEQTTEWIGAWKKAFSFFPVNPPDVLLRRRRSGRPNRRRDAEERHRPGSGADRGRDRDRQAAGRCVFQDRRDRDRCVPEHGRTLGRSAEESAGIRQARRARRCSRPPRSRSATGR